jgi:hypothetical protein
MAHLRPFSTSALQDLSKWYKEHLNVRSFDPYNQALSFGNPQRLQVPTFGCVSFIVTLASKWGCDRLKSIIFILKVHNSNNFYNYANIKCGTNNQFNILKKTP